jgi:hypothetical protein
LIILDLEMGWHNVEGGSCVYVSDKMYDIYSAAKYCNDMDAIIFEPTSKEEQLAVDDLVTTYVGLHYWIGITDMETEEV